MSDLTVFRDHARVMATAEHLPTCRGHQPPRWGWAREIRPDPRCAGCVTAADRDLWTRLADEVDAYLGGDEEPGLFADDAAVRGGEE